MVEGEPTPQEKGELRESDYEAEPTYDSYHEDLDLVMDEFNKRNEGLGKGEQLHWSVLPDITKSFFSAGAIEAKILERDGVLRTYAPGRYGEGAERKALSNECMGLDQYEKFVNDNRFTSTRLRGPKLKKMMADLYRGVDIESAHSHNVPPVNTAQSKFGPEMRFLGAVSYLLSQEKEVPASLSGHAQSLQELQRAKKE